MATKTWAGKLTNLQVVTADFDTFVLGATSSITVNSGSGISDLSSITGKALKISGDVTSQSASGIFLNGSHYAITVAASSAIDGGTNGFVLMGASSTLSNAGDIHGGNVGLAAEGKSIHVTNTGSISSGFYGVQLDGVGGVLSNAKGATISGDASSIYFGNTSGVTTFVNDGLVTGIYQSIGGDSGRTVITNRGTIEAAVYLGDGNDTFINKGGIAKGVIDLEAGSDLYVLDKATIKVAESDLGNFGDVDKVKASVSMLLGKNIEDLVLTGGRDLKGTGNALGNHITGNAGDNILDGKGGDDTFIFAKGCGSDTILHFTDKHDKIDLSSYAGITGWADIKHHIASVSGDVVVTLANGDTITIDSTASSLINWTDFVF